jgi:hypothetical protein
VKIPEGLELDQYIELTSMMEAQQIKSAGHWREEVIERSKGEKIWGATLPWSKTWDTFRLREGELTIVAGSNGAKKSMIVGQICLALAKHSKVCIASLEMKPSETLWRMCLQSAGSKGWRPFRGVYQPVRGFCRQKHSGLRPVRYSFYTKNPCGSPLLREGIGC